MLYVASISSRRGKGVQAKVVPSDATVPACTRGAENKAISMHVVASVEHETVSMGRSTRQSETRSYIINTLRVSLLKFRN
jgi:hypothetical protein